MSSSSILGRKRPAPTAPGIIDYDAQFSNDDRFNGDGDMHADVNVESGIDVDPSLRHTPKTRRRILRECMPVTPMSSASQPAYVPSPRADGLDALAAVACTTSASLLSSSPMPSASASPSPSPMVRRRLYSPNSSRMTSPASRSLPGSTPNLSAMNWVSRLVAVRPELVNEDSDGDDDDDDETDNNNSHENNELNGTHGLNDGSDQHGRRNGKSTMPITESLRSVVVNESDWSAIVTDARDACRQIRNAPGPISDVGRYTCDARALYFAALDGLLRDEAVRLQGRGEEDDAAKCKLSSKLVRNKVFHHSVMAFAWECAVAASGRYDMRMLWTAMTALDLSPFALTKVVEAFVKRFRDMPQHLKVHMMTCDARIIEHKLWKHGSELVTVLTQRHGHRQLQTDRSQARGGQGRAGHGKDGDDNRQIEPALNRREGESKTNKESDSVSPLKEVKSARKEALRAKDVVLQMVYKKVLGLASLRAQELLLLLGLDRLAEPVWTCFKSCIWQQWHLMVDRHLDQLIMCCIYGVVKVRRIDVKFKEIVAMYRTMKHVREPSFTPLLQNVIRNVSLASHSSLTSAKRSDKDMHDGPESQPQEEEQQYGDVIKFYNDIFIPSMKHLLLEFKFEAVTNKQAPQRSTNLANNCSPSDHPQTGSTEIKINTNGKPPTADKGTSPLRKPEQTEFRDGQNGVGNTYEGHTTAETEANDALREAVLKSPMRSLRSHSLKRIGRVTVGPMSPGDSALVALRQSPARRSHSYGHLKVMTPGTRTLYAFESPGMMTKGSNGRRSEMEDEDGDSNPGDIQRHLNFDVQDMKEKTATVRKRFAGVLAGMGSRVRFANANSNGAGNTTDGLDSDENGSSRERN